MTLTDEQRAEGWRENTGECPVQDPRTCGDVLMADDEIIRVLGLKDECEWVLDHDDPIIAYRITVPFGADVPARASDDEAAYPPTLWRQPWTGEVLTEKPDRPWEWQDYVRADLARIPAEAEIARLTAERDAAWAAGTEAMHKAVVAKIVDIQTEQMSGSLYGDDRDGWFFAFDDAVENIRALPLPARPGDPQAGEGTA